MKHLLLPFLLICTLAASAQDSITKNISNTRLIYPVLWQQTAAEYRALCYQAYNIATLRLQQLSRKTKRKKNLAIITDIDETVLDNSYFEVELIKNNIP